MNSSIMHYVVDEVLLVCLFHICVVCGVPSQLATSVLTILSHFITPMKLVGCKTEEVY